LTAGPLFVAAVKAVVGVAVVGVRCCVLVCTGVHPIYNVQCYCCVPVCILFTRCSVIAVFRCASYLQGAVLLLCSGVHPIYKVLCYCCVPVCIIFTWCSVIVVFRCSPYLQNRTASVGTPIQRTESHYISKRILQWASTCRTKSNEETNNHRTELRDTAIQLHLPWNRHQPGF